jgi:flagellar hook-length control protein FliK
MTANVDTNMMQTQGAKNAPNGTAAALQKGGIGGQQQGIDFITMILSRLQQDGTIPQSTETSPSPSGSVDGLKGKLQEIISGFAANQASAGNAEQNAKLFQNGTALPQQGAGKNAALFQNGIALPQQGASENAALFHNGTALSQQGAQGQNLQANGLIEQITSLLQQTSASTPSAAPAAPGQAGIMNNGLLAQQLGLDPAKTDDVEIFAALKDALSGLGIQLNNNGEPVLQQSIEPQTPAQDTAHLNTQTSLQGTAQNASPAPQIVASEISPQNAQLSASPAEQNDAANATTGEAFLLEQAMTGQNTATTEAGVAQSFVSVEAAQQNAQRSAQSPAMQGQTPAPAQDTLQKVMTGQTSQNNTPAPNGQPSSSSASPNMSENMMAQTAPPPSGQNGMSFGAGSFGNSPFGQGANGFGAEGGFDGEMAQQLRQENSQMNQRAATQTAYGNNGQYRPGAVPQQAQIIKAVTLNMSRGANNAIERMSLQLEPAELGRVKIDLKMGDDGMLKAHIFAEKADTVQILQRDSSALQKAMSEAGLDVGSESFSFDLSQGQDQELAEDRNSKEMLFDLNGIEGIEEDDFANGSLTAGLYGQQYIRPSGVNVYA